jgi:Ala-tRNA(Pro) deacylase
MPLLERLRMYLDSHHARYSVTSHRAAFTANAMASAEHLPAREVAKIVVAYGDGHFMMLVVPANRQVDLNEVKHAIGLKHVRLASEAELLRLFPDCEVGAMPPVGNLYDMPLYLDADLAKEDIIAFPGGTHQETVHMHMGDFRMLTGPKVVHMARMQVAGFGGY